ncbi:MAG TPA: hypothetical protein PLU85_00050 [Bacteroidia bacterium]|nr:hypothetical protein [Bacteroidia bacterium]MBP7714638.1 hypothetical protein [Bacteroidia bacterium]MBP8669613.1 hypothetical protein [Bacteroidia bacterium]HOZ82750.1 hypothetical protein [Bacteroidia bacterium]HQW16983.1 hypothetical protein [Bacteroidia bacterium]
MSTNKTDSKERSIRVSRIERIHPYRTILFFGILISSLLFLTLSFLFLITQNENNNMPPALPKVFTLSTILLLFGSYTISKAVSAFRKDSFDKLLRATILTTIITSLFLVTQIIGLHAMQKTGYYTNMPFNSHYFFGIIALHMVHALATVAYLIFITYNAFHQSHDVIDSLLFFSDQGQLLKLNSAMVFSHFVNFSWLAIFLMFLFSF